MNHINLVIVESPAKAKTLEKYLGSKFKVKASVGHIKDLPKSKLGVDVKNHFEPQYVILKDKKKILTELLNAAKNADKVYLAPDPDREGEAIAWHIYEEVKKINKNIYRVSFNEITQRAVQKAFENPQGLNENKFNAQQTRRILDRLVGYLISPILWDKVQRGLSAGRVQSVAVRLIVEREREIQAFKPEEYWTISAKFEKKGHIFEAKLFKIKDNKPEISNGETAQSILKDLALGNYQITKIEKKERRKNPYTPYITSTLQQDAFIKYRYSAKRTMGIAQKLYEGVDLGLFGTHGLITYMRTDSPNIAQDALKEVRAYIEKTFGKNYIPQTPHIYQSKKGAQEAHECIRPTSLEFEPQKIKNSLSPEEFKLYSLIWDRFVACQMSEAVFDQTSVDIQNKEYLFRATGSLLKFEGYLKVYGDKEEVSQIPALEEQEVLKPKKVEPAQHFTQPPPRYNEGSLVKELESNGIGRPSTYAAIISNIIDRKYVKKEENRLSPTDLGFLITDLLVKSFPNILNVEFTATMENSLDDIEEGKQDWIKILENFYKPFNQNIEKAKKEMKDIKGEETPTEHKCPKCASTMVIKWGRHGKFLACSKYPECRSTSDFKEVEGEITLVQTETKDKCEKCKSPMVIKFGRFGKFLACSNYPECKTTKSISIGVKCPLPNCTGEVTEKRSKKGRFFYGCSKYPQCNFVSWNKPILQECPQCHATYLLEKVTKKEGKTLFCHNKECSYKAAA